MKKRIIQTVESNDGFRVTYTKKRSNNKGILFRYIAAVLIFGVIFGISKLDIEIGNKITEVIKTAIIFDLDSSENRTYGHIPKSIEKSDSDADADEAKD